MKFKIVRTLVKENNLIKETFTIDKNPAFIDSSKKISIKIKDLFSSYSIGKDFKFISSVDLDFKRINIFEYNNIIQPELYKEFYFIYIGNLSKKKCETCDYCVLINNKKACWIKGKYIDKNSYYKCQWYLEKINEILK